MAMNRIWASGFTDIVATIGVAIVFVAAWEFLPPLFNVPRYVIPTFTDCLQEGLRLWREENLLMHFNSTLTATFFGFILGSLCGAVLGYLLGLSSFWERILSPYILALQISPKVAFAPLFIIWFGYNIWPKLVVATLITFFPILVNCLQAMKTVDRDLINLARAYKMSRAQIFWKIEFPASLPNLMAGLRIGATLAVIGITVGELVGSNMGLGYLLAVGEGQGNTATVFNAIVLLTVVGIAFYSAVAAVEARVLHYLPKTV